MKLFQQVLFITLTLSLAHLSLEFIPSLSAFSFPKWVSLAQSRSIYQPEKLIELERRVVETTAQGKTPVLLFDVDDTLIKTASRMALAIRDFAQMKINSGSKSPELTTLLSFGSYDVRWSPEESLKAFGIQDQALISELTPWVMKRFLGNEYCIWDEPVEGAPEFLHTLLEKGATLVYLTGRDQENMMKPTLENLRVKGFPLPGKRVHLMMKPHPQEDDLAYKRTKFAETSALGKVIGVFENEPKNLNEMMAYFDEAWGFFLDQRHTLDKTRPHPHAIWLWNFHKIKNI